MQYLIQVNYRAMSIHCAEPKDYNTQDYTEAIINNGPFAADGHMVQETS